MTTPSDSPSAPGPKKLAAAVAAVAAFAGLHAVLAYRYICVGLMDDSYIDYRYAENIVDGFGMVWNPGEEPLLGFTSMLWVRMLVIGEAVFGSVPVASARMGVGMGMLTIVLAAVLFWRLAPAHRRTLMWVPAGALAFSPVMPYHALNGLDTTTTSSLLLAMGILATWGKAWTSVRNALLLALPLTFVTFLSRPDAILFPFMVSLVMMVRHGPEDGSWLDRVRTKPILAYLGGLAVVLGVYHLWVNAHFGHPLPLPFYQKSGLLRIYSNMHLVNYVYGHMLTGLAFAGIPLFLLLLRLRSHSKLPTGVLFIVSAAALIYAAYFCTVLPIMSYWWRFLWPPYAVLLTAASIALVELIEPLWEEGWWKRCTVVALLLLFLGHNVGRFYEVKRRAREVYSHHAVFGVIGQRLAQIEGHRDLVGAISEVGQFSYWSRWRIVDVSGLNERRIALMRHGDPESLASTYWTYLEETYGIPDVYFLVRSEYEYGVLESNPVWRERYEAIEIPNTLETVYVHKGSARYSDIRQALLEIAERYEQDPGSVTFESITEGTR